MYYDPEKMAQAIEGMTRALRRVPIWVPEFETAHQYAARVAAWRKENAQAIEDAENPWMSEVERLLREQAPYVK